MMTVAKQCLVEKQTKSNPVLPEPEVNRKSASAGTGTAARVARVVANNANALSHFIWVAPIVAPLTQPAPFFAVLPLAD